MFAFESLEILMSIFAYPDHQSQCDRVISTSFASEYYGGIEGFISRTRVSAGYNVHGIPFHMIGINVGNTVAVLRRYRDETQIQDFRPGDMILAPTGTALESAHALTIDAVYIYLDPRFVALIGQTIGTAESALIFRAELGKYDPTIQGIGLHLAHEIQFLNAGSKLLIESLITHLSIHLIRNYSQVPVPATSDAVLPTTSRDLFAAIDFVHAHLNENISLSTLATVAHLSPFHFSRLFKKRFGVSPYQYVIHQRIEKARQLLKNPSLTVSEIALMVGFTDHSHLIRHFKRLTGKAPRAL